MGIKQGVIILSLMVFALLTFYVLMGSNALNNPYPEEQRFQNIYYASFSAQPKTLDPARSYSSDEYQFTSQIYEPLLEYDYFKRPYKLVPLTVKHMPQVHYYDQNRQLLDEDGHQSAAWTIYTIQIRTGIYFQPHPAFAKDGHGHFRYHHLLPDYLDEHYIYHLSDFTYNGTRELLADDYIYQIKRLANPAVNAPIYGLLSEYIEGFDKFGKQLPKQYRDKFLDLRHYPLKGVRKLNDYAFEITIKGEYPQFLFWLAMPFFAPIPWEAEAFYHQPGMADVNLGLGWYPVGTGPFMLTENNPNRHMVLTKNPNYRNILFPGTFSNEDLNKGYVHHPGASIPLITGAIYTLEKEAIPRWNKFMQGYYDLSGVGADSFDQAIQISRKGDTTLTPQMQNKGIRLTKMADASIFYLGFNMLDSTVGGASKRARKLRQAISIAVNYDEFIAIFFNGRGFAAQSPIPPGIFGYQNGETGTNPVVYRWQDGTRVRRAIDDAKKLMIEAGYPGGIDPKTGKPLMIHYDVPASGGPDDKAQLNWMRKQFANIGIALNVRATQYNRFQEKIRTGNTQLFSWGWNADYPDPENFLFLLYGPNGKVRFGGENAANYANPMFDKLFMAMKNKPNTPERQRIISKIVALLQNDAPWVWGVNSQSLLLSQPWVAPMKPNTMSHNTLKYVAINVPLRNKLRQEWNQPIWWPIGIFIFIMGALLLPFYIMFKRKENEQAPRISL